MSIEKSLSSAPMGLESLAPPEDEGIEIEIEDPESVEIHIGDLDIKIGSVEDDFDANLVDELDSDVVSQLVSELIEDFDDDVNSRKEWMQTYVDGLELLGMKIEERAEPWIGACGVYHPLLSEAVVKFQAEVMMSTFPAAGPVKTQIIGKETPEKKQAATRVAADMNYELTDVMTEFRPEHERMLWGLGLAGNAFKKVYFDPNLDRQTSIFVPAEDLVVPYGASDLQTADRITHVMRKTENEIRKLQVAGFYSDIDLGEPNNNLDDVEKKIAEKMGFRATTDDRYKILEINVNLDLEGFEDTDKDGEPTGIALPYIVTVEKGSEKCLAIRRNWNKDDKLKSKRQHFVHYGYVPGFGFYCFGLIHLVGAFAKSGTSILRQLVDAGTLANLPGGFKTRGLRVKGDDTPIGPAEWRDVDVPSGTISDNIMALPYKEPSQVLALLLDKIVDEGRKFASAADIQVADMSANSPVGTTLAILERTLKVMTAVQARIHYSFKQELILLRDIIRDYTPPTYNYEPDEGSPKAKQSDYDLVTVIPVSDPNAATMAQKIVQYQAVIQLSQQAPDIYDLPQLHRQMLDVLGIKNAEKLVKLEEDEVPVDPVSENMNALNGKPMKAFMFQDHKAHMTVHQMFMQDPMIMQTIGQNPKANQIMASLQAHIAEHLAFEYRKQIEQQMGVPLPAPGERLPEDVEVQLSQLMAQAGQQVNQSNSAAAQQQKAQQMAQDPLIQMQQQELQLKNAEIQRKQQKDQQEMQIKSSQLQLDSMELQNKKDVEMARIQAEAARTQMQLQSTSAIAQAKLQAETQHNHQKNVISVAQLKSQAEAERQRNLANFNKGNK